MGGSLLMREVLIPLNSGLAWSKGILEAFEFGQRLNPFEFRASLERQKWQSIGYSRVLIPLNSGLAWSLSAHGESKRRTVLIPLNSGLAWSRSHGRSHGRSRLNPFEFRASLEQLQRSNAKPQSLNPFEFRASLELQGVKNPCTTTTYKGR